MISITVAYLFTAQLGHVFDQSQYFVTLVYPATGIALGAMLIYGPMIMPAIVLGIVIEQLILNTPYLIIPGMVISGVGAAFISWWGMVSLNKFQKSIENVDVCLTLLFWGATVGPLFSAINGVLWLYIGDLVPVVSIERLLYWWMADALGILLLVPPFLLLVDQKYSSSKHNQRYLVWMITVSFSCVLVFTDILIPNSQHLLSPTIFFPFIIWGAYYVGLSAVHAGVFLVFMSAFSSHLFGVGFYAEQVELISTDLWFFVTTLSITGLAVGASNVQREQAEWKAASSRMNDLLENPDLTLPQLLEMQCTEAVDGNANCYSAILLLNDTNTQLNLYAAKNLPTSISTVLHTIDMKDETAMTYCINNGKMLSSLDEPELWHNVQDRISTWGGATCVPIMNLFRKPLGVLCVFYTSSTRFQLANLELHQRVAYQSSLLISRKRSESALRAMQLETENERALLRSMIDSNPDLIFIKDSDGRYILCNHAFEEFSGMKEQDIIGKRYSDLFKFQIDIFLEAMDQKILFSHSGALREELWVNYPNGKEVLIDLVKAPLKDSDNKTYGVIGLGRDITENRELESELIAITENQQRFIGQELHDGVGQKVVGLAFLAKVLEQQLEIEQSPSTQHAHTLASNINETIAEIRGLARGLLPIELESNGLSAALEALATKISQTFSISCVFKMDTPTLIDDQVKSLNLYRITQEAVNNAIRHGQADSILIQLKTHHRKVTLTIKDNGTGFDIDKYKAGNVTGIGLKSMQYRASLMRADLAFSRPAEGGFEVSVSLS